jgi:hypothetical protein
MVLVLLGLIVVGAAVLLIYYSLTPGKRGSDSGEGNKRSFAREKQYDKSDDGKVVYLYDRNEKAADGDETAETDDAAENGRKDDGDDTGKGGDAD